MTALLSRCGLEKRSRGISGTPLRIISFRIFLEGLESVVHLYRAPLGDGSEGGLVGWGGGLRGDFDAF